MWPHIIILSNRASQPISPGCTGTLFFFFLPYIHVYILPGPGNYSQHTSNLLFNKTSTPGTVLYTLINTLRVRS